jgi:hypothetical protein
MYTHRAGKFAAEFEKMTADAEETAACRGSPRIKRCIGDPLRLTITYDFEVAGVAAAGSFSKCDRLQARPTSATARWTAGVCASPILNGSGWVYAPDRGAGEQPAGRWIGNGAGSA